MASETNASYVDSRRIGDAVVSIICDGSFYWAPEIQAPEAEWRRAMPEANGAGEIKIDLNVAIVRLGAAVVLVDLGFGEPSSAWPQLDPRFRRSPGVLAGLVSLGIRPEDVTHVLITHAHGDHFEGATLAHADERVPTFPRARYFMQRADWEGNRARENPDFSVTRHLGTLNRLGRLDLLDGDREIAPGIAMLHAPGESPGHAVVRVSSAGESFYYLGDLFHHTCEVERLDWVSRGRDPGVERASRERILADAIVDRATLIFTHHRFPGWGRVLQEGTGYVWRDA